MSVEAVSGPGLRLSAQASASWGASQRVRLVCWHPRQHATTLLGEHGPSLKSAGLHALPPPCLPWPLQLRGMVQAQEEWPELAQNCLRQKKRIDGGAWVAPTPLHARMHVPTRLPCWPAPAPCRPTCMPAQLLLPPQSVTCFLVSDPPCHT